MCPLANAQIATKRKPMSPVHSTMAQPMTRPRASSVPKTGATQRTSAGATGRADRSDARAAADHGRNERASAEPANSLHAAAAQQIKGFWFRPSILNVKLVYAAYLTSLAIPFAAIIAVVFAYQSRRRGAAGWLASHYTYQIRTFWIGLGANIVATALSFAGVGLLLFPLIAVWVVARAVNGLILVAQSDPVRDPESLLI